MNLETPSAPADGGQMAPGVMLRIARKRTGLSLEEAARAANLTLSIATALEEDDYPRLGLPVYARGYYRRYARIVQCEASAVVSAYEIINNVPSAVPQIQQRPSIPYGGQSPLRKLAPVAVIAVLGGLVLWIYLGQAERAPQPAVPEVTDASPVAAQNRPPQATPTLEPLPDLGAARRPPTVDLQQDPQAAAPSAAAPADSASTAGAANSSPATPPQRVGLLEIELGSEPAWVEVTDAAGIRLAYRIADAGETLRLQGDPPYRVNLGRAYSLTLRYAGEELDLSRFTDSAARARATIAADGSVSGS